MKAVFILTARRHTFVMKSRRGSVTAKTRDMYKIPQTLSGDISRLSSQAEDYLQGRLPAEEFKSSRVPMGIYEQRQDGTYMARIRTTGGIISPSQFLEVIQVARRNGSGLLHITTRQEIQIQNLDLAVVEPVLSELADVGLSTKGGGGNTIRNIIVSELSGISPAETFDTTPYAIGITSKLIAEPDSFLLPRKMKIAFASNAEEEGYAAINDVGFVARVVDGREGFKVYVGGGAGAKPTVGWVLFDFIPAEEFCIVTAALKKFFSDHGNRRNRHKARLRSVFYSKGVEETLALIRSYYEAARYSTSLYALRCKWNERPVHNYTAPSIKPEQGYYRWKARYVSGQPQAGYSTVFVPVELGNINLDDAPKTRALQNLLYFVSTFGKHTIRFTDSQSIRLRNIPDEALAELYTKLKDFVQDVEAPVVVNTIVSCTGADTCRLGLGLSKGLAKAIREELLQSTVNLDRAAGVRIHVSGCPNSCGQPLWADIGFTGKVMRSDRIYPAYQIYAASHRSSEPKLAEPLGSLSAKRIPLFVRRMMEGYCQSGVESVTEYLEGEGNALALVLIEEYKDIPSYGQDASFYTDWGADREFSIDGRGKGECAYDLFSVVDMDMKNLRVRREELGVEDDPVHRSGLLYDIVYLSSRMLLVTRGADPKITEDVFNMFISQLVEEGFVDMRFKSIVAGARDAGADGVAGHENEVLALADAVEGLYSLLGESMQLRKEDVRLVI